MGHSSAEAHDCCAHHDSHHELLVNGLSVHYRKLLAIENISLATSCGNRIALVGPNGAGKSTLLKAITGLVPRSAGSITWRGTEIRKWSREFAYLPQREEIDWTFPITVRGLVEMGRYPHLGLLRRYSPADREAVNAAMETLNVSGIQDRQIRELSGGQQQRAFLARAVAQDAHVLLLDEPFTGLDEPTSQALADLILELSGQGRLIIASHHDLKSTARIYNQTLLLNRQPIAFGPTPDVLTEPHLSRGFEDPGSAGVPTRPGAQGAVISDP